MAMPTLRLLPFATADGPVNMARDETLLAAAAGQPSLRFYGWSPPTLSLGYFQPHTCRLSDPLLAALPFVRRPSGGATLVHHHELTYALALPAAPSWRMHQLVRAALAELGVVAASADVEELAPSGDPLCFRHVTPGDLTVASHKVVGSAVRRQRGAWLLHGSILLGASPYAPSLPGVRELSGRDVTPGELAEAVARRLVAETGWRVVDGAWTEEERRAVEGLVEGRYGTDGWNRKR